VSDVGRVNSPYRAPSSPADQAGCGDEHDRSGGSGTRTAGCRLGLGWGRGAQGVQGAEQGVLYSQIARPALSVIGIRDKGESFYPSCPFCSLKHIGP
jgi:hypothetical protein